MNKLMNHMTRHLNESHHSLGRLKTFITSKLKNFVALEHHIFYILLVFPHNHIHNRYPGKTNSHITPYSGDSHNVKSFPNLTSSNLSNLGK